MDREDSLPAGDDAEVDAGGTGEGIDASLPEEPLDDLVAEDLATVTKVLVAVYACDGCGAVAVSRRDVHHLTGSPSAGPSSCFGRTTRRKVWMAPCEPPEVDPTGVHGPFGCADEDAAIAEAVLALPDARASTIEDTVPRLYAVTLKRYGGVRETARGILVDGEPWPRIEFRKVAAARLVKIVREVTDEILADPRGYPRHLWEWAFDLRYEMDVPIGDSGVTYERALGLYLENADKYYRLPACVRSRMDSIRKLV